MTFRPSTYPVSLRPWRNALNGLAKRSGDELPRNPITGMPGCCARAASGHTTAAPPRKLKKSRRLTFTPKAQRRAIVAAKTGTLEGVDVRFGSKADICAAKVMSALPPIATSIALALRASIYRHQLWRKCLLAFGHGDMRDAVVRGAVKLCRPVVRSRLFLGNGDSIEGRRSYSDGNTYNR